MKLQRQMIFIVIVMIEINMAARVSDLMNI
jgi:hypothetical protein